MKRALDSAKVGPTGLPARVGVTCISSGATVQAYMQCHVMHMGEHAVDCPPDVGILRFGWGLVRRSTSLSLGPNGFWFLHILCESTHANLGYEQYPSLSSQRSSATVKSSALNSGADAALLSIIEALVTGVALAWKTVGAAVGAFTR